jgi:hypothetical protein
MWVYEGTLQLALLALLIIALAGAAAVAALCLWYPLQNDTGAPYSVTDKRLTVRATRRLLDPPWE